MKLYRVEWTIDIEADSPKEAAQKAREIQRRRRSTATVFDVKEFDTEDDAVRIDLQEAESS